MVRRTPDAPSTGAPSTVARPGTIAATVAAALVCLATATPAHAQLAPLPSAAGSGLGGGSQQALTFLPGVRTSLTWSDNLSRGSSGNEKSGWQAEVAPSITASMRSARAEARLGYALGATYRSVDGDSDSSIRHTLNASGNALLVDDWFGVRGTASSQYVNTSPFGVTTADPIRLDANTTRVSRATLNPYVVGRAGTVADYRVDYSINRTSTSRSTEGILARGSQEAKVTVVSGPQFRRWGWSVVSSGRVNEYRNGVDLNSASTVANVYYVFGPELRVGASANYRYIEGFTNAKGESNGWGPGVSVDWAPNPRTSLRASASDDYYGNSANLALSHRAQRWTFGLNYGRGVFTSNNAGLILFNPGNLVTGGAYDALLNSVFQQLVSDGVITDADTILGAGVINDAVVRSRSLTATVGYRLQQGSVSLTAYRAVRETLLDSTLFLTPTDPLVTSTFGRFLSRGVRLGVGIPLSTRTTVSFGGSVSETESLDNPDAARTSSLDAKVSTRFDARTTGSLGVRRTVQSAVAGNVVGYDENAIVGTVDMRF